MALRDGIIERAGPRLDSNRYGGVQVATFAGIGSATMNHSARELARQMQAMGEDDQSIFDETREQFGQGFFFDPVDKNWKYEIPDTDAKLLQEPRYMLGAGPVSLDGFLDHAELYVAYPHLKNVLVEFYEAEPMDRGWFSASKNTIGINVNNLPEQILYTLIHESNHVIQKFEDFSLGGSHTSQETWDIATYLYDMTDPEEVKKYYDALRPWKAKRNEQVPVTVNARMEFVNNIDRYEGNPMLVASLFQIDYDSAEEVLSDLKKHPTIGQKEVYYPRELRRAAAELGDIFFEQWETNNPKPAAPWKEGESNYDKLFKIYQAYWGERMSRLAADTLSDAKAGGTDYEIVPTARLDQRQIDSYKEIEEVRKVLGYD